MPMRAPHRSEVGFAGNRGRFHRMEPVAYVDLMRLCGRKAHCRTNAHHRALALVRLISLPLLRFRPGAAVPAARRDVAVVWRTIIWNSLDRSLNMAQPCTNSTWTPRRTLVFGRPDRDCPRVRARPGRSTPGPVGASASNRQGQVNSDAGIPPSRESSDESGAPTRPPFPGPVARPVAGAETEGGPRTGGERSSESDRGNTGISGNER